MFMMDKRYENIVNHPEEIVDGPYIADMLVPLTHDEAEARAKRFSVAPPDKDTQFYSCRHWNEDTRLCMAYESRPGMCRKYPYDRACNFGCGLVLLEAEQTQSLPLR